MSRHLVTPLVLVVLAVGAPTPGQDTQVWEVGSLTNSPPEEPKEPKKSDPAGTKKADEGKKPRMVRVGVLVLISAKTAGISEGANIKQIAAPKESIGKRDISNAHITKGRATESATAAQPRLNGTWVRKTCTVTLDDGKILEKREVLFGIDFPEQALKNLRFVETVQAQSDQGVGTWYAYDAADMQLPGPPDPGAIFRAPDSFTLDVALTADGKLLARAGADETADLWDVASGKKLHTLKGHTAPLFKVAFSPDGKTLASITGTWLPDDVRGEVKLWDVATGKERVALKGHPGRGVALAFSPDGKTLATCGKTAVKLWDMETGKEKMELSADALSLAFSPDGQTLATATKSVILWDVTTGKKRATLPEHKTILAISCVRFAPDGKTVASVSGAAGLDKDQFGTLQLWDVGTAKERAAIPIRMATPLQSLDFAFTADGKTMISAMWSFGETQNEGGLAVQHWDLATGKARAAFWSPFNFSGPGGAGTNAGVFFSALSADGKTVAWGGAEEKDKRITGTAHVWDVESLATSPHKLK